MSDYFTTHIQNHPAHEGKKEKIFHSEEIHVCDELPPYAYTVGFLRLADNASEWVAPWLNILPQYALQTGFVVFEEVKSGNCLQCLQDFMLDEDKSGYYLILRNDNKKFLLVRALVYHIIKLTCFWYSICMITTTGLNVLAHIFSLRAK